MEEEYTMYIIINNDLNMNRGKAASQAAHAAEKIAVRVMKTNRESAKPKEFVTNYDKYLQSGSKKIVLKGTQKELETFAKEDDAEYVIDAGRTEVPSGSLTSVAFLPSNRNKDKFKNFKLLN